MELANIEELLKKYLDAETTIAEEKELKITEAVSLRFSKIISISVNNLFFKL